MIRVCLVNLAAVFALSSCFDEKASPEVQTTETPEGFVKPSSLVVDEATGVSSLDGTPFSGPVVTREKDWSIKYFAQYRDGQLHGPELRYYDDGVTVRRWYDWVEGEKVRHREFYENGQIKLDAMTKNGEAYGKHRTWDEKGMLRFDGNFVENLQWDGPVKDVDAEGNVLWDAVFEKGRYVSGIYPKQEEQSLIEAGMLDPETLQPTAQQDSEE